MKTIIISGATGNLGRAIAHKFLNNGYFVSGTVLPGEQVTIDEAHSFYETTAVNLLEEENTRNFVDRVSAERKSIDVAALTAGGFAMGNIASTGISDITKQYKLNFETAYNLARPVFLKMLSQGFGRIFLIGSRPGEQMRNSGGTVAYGLSKSLIFRLAELMNEESKGKDVVTSVIVPSIIDTPQNRASMPDADFTKWVTADAIAEIIYFYSGPGGSAFREPVIKVYGGS